MIPMAVTKRGKNTASVVSKIGTLDAETTSAAHVDSAKDPNKSAPMPAMSPTLSPTLSAIVPGLSGESSGRP